MLIKEIHVKNFRCLKNETLTCENLTSLIGKNSAGKSSFLYALDFFFEIKKNYSEDDFYNKNTDDPITIRIAFKNLTEYEKEKFSPYIENDELSVEKEIHFPYSRTSQKYYGSRMGIAQFKEIGELSKAADQKNVYNQLKLTVEFDDLPPWKRKLMLRLIS